MSKLDSLNHPVSKNSETAPADSKTFLDSLRDTFRNKRLMALITAIGILAGCEGKCTFGKKEAFGCSCTDTGPKKNNNSDYKRLKVDKSDL